MIPKGFRTNINTNPSKIGVPRRQEILDGIAENGTFLPRGVSEEDMDRAFIDFVNNELGITLDGRKIPVFFLTIQRWTEFTKTWKFDEGEYEDIQMPFITVVRQPDIQVGNNQAGLWNIPGNRTYTYMKVPTFDGARKGVDLYKIPQPTSVDINYEVRLFTTRMKDLNKLNTKIHKSFQSRQSYINVNGHPMPVHLEGVSDESNIDDFENRRFYIQQFEMTLLGYILDEDDFEVVPTINRLFNFIEVQEKKPYREIILDEQVNINQVNFTFIFKPNADPQFSFTAKYNVNFTQLSGIERISRIVIIINGIGVFDGLILNTPITFREGDLITIRVSKVGADTGKFQLIGNTI